MAMEIRRYRCADRRAVWELHNLALHGVGAHAGNGLWDRDLHRIEAEYLAPGGEFYVGLIGARIMAVGALKRLSSRRGEIKRMRVHPELQGRGLGVRMLRALEECATTRGIASLVLETTAGQTAARSLCTGRGYHQMGSMRQGPFEVLRYEKRSPFAWREPSPVPARRYRALSTDFVGTG